MREDLHGDVNPRSFAPPQSAIRVCTPDDIDWLMELARTRYDTINDVNLPAVKAWLLERFNDPLMCFMRGKHSMGVSHMARRFMAPDRMQCYLVLLVSFPSKVPSMEPYRIAEAMAQWGKSKGATKFWMSDISGYDLGSFAKRMGGRDAGHTYIIDLDDKGGRFG